MESDNFDMGSILDAVSGLTGSDVVLTAASSDDANLTTLVKDHIYGLLSKDSLNDKEVILLSSLLQSRLL